MNKLRTIELRLRGKLLLQDFIEKHNTSRHYMWRFIAGLSAARNTESAEKKIKTVPHVFYDCAEMYKYTAIINLCCINI